ncbi:MAG TPA: hypothetical protein VGQ94_03230 [Terriglobales bacterium]|nr:hypothetical protein [Terriglobales bacterium]
MKQWSALLGAELRSWPGVTTKPMFGFVSFYRGRNIFAGLPRTRAMNSANSIIFKLRRAAPQVLAKLRRDPRAKVSEKGMAGWQSLEVDSTADLKHALDRLDRAYRNAR